MRIVVVAALALLTAGAATAAAWDPAPAPTLDEVMDAGLGGEVRWFGRAVEIDGVHLHETIAWSAALPPVTSQNAVFATTRVWGPTWWDRNARGSSRSQVALPAGRLGGYGPAG